MLRFSQRYGILTNMGGQHQRPPAITQAGRIFEKFGGARGLMRALAAIGKPKNPATCFKWTYSRAKGGTGGVIPSSALPDVLMAARHEGILITPDDLYKGDGTL